MESLLKCYVGGNTYLWIRHSTSPQTVVLTEALGAGKHSSDFVYCIDFPLSPFFKATPEHRYDTVTIHFQVTSLSWAHSSKNPGWAFFPPTSVGHKRPLHDPRYEWREGHWCNGGYVQLTHVIRSCLDLILDVPFPPHNGLLLSLSDIRTW